MKNVITKAQGKQNKKDTSNSKLFKHVINALDSILSRRSSQSYSTMIINDILKTIEDKFEFLKYVKVLKTGHSEKDFEILDILDEFESVNPIRIGRAIESIIRLSSMNLKEKDAGLYFITELKENINEKYISELKKRDVDIDIIKFEQHYLYTQNKRKITLPKSYKKEKLKDEKRSKFASLINFAWEKVSFWEYNDNICTIYDKKGNILDRLPLDRIVKEYILEFTGFDEPPLNSDKIVELNEKEYEFIKLLYSKDLHAEKTKELLNISSTELSIIIRKLLVYEILQYISYDELMLTENGIKKVEERK